MSQSVAIRNTTKGKLPSLPFRRIKEEILGPDYDLSVVFVGQAKIRTLNRAYRQKDTATDVLSFPLSENSGEIFLCPEQIRVKAQKIPRPTKKHLIFLFIHGLLHLKGLDHGSRMEREEKAFASRFGVDVEHLINGKKNSGRHRHRDVPDQSGRGREHRP